MPILTVFVQVIIGLLAQVAGYLMMGGEKKEKGEDVKDLEAPTAEAGRPIPVLFGELEIHGLNCLWSGEKSLNKFEVGGGK